MTVRSLVALSLTAAAVLAPAAPAAASCAAGYDVADLARADGGVVVVEVLEQRGPRAHLQVEEVWSGPDRPERLWAITASTDPRVHSSGDRYLGRGARYVLALSTRDVPSTSECKMFRVDDGSGTLSVTDAPRTSVRDVGAARPGDSRAPLRHREPDKSRAWLLSAESAAGAGAALLLALDIAALQRSRRRGQRLDSGH